MHSLERLVWCFRKQKGSLADYMYTLLYMQLCLYVTENTYAPLFWIVQFLHIQCSNFKFDLGLYHQLVDVNDNWFRTTHTWWSIGVLNHCLSQHLQLDYLTIINSDKNQVCPKDLSNSSRAYTCIRIRAGENLVF